MKVFFLQIAFCGHNLDETKTLASYGVGASCSDRALFLNPKPIALTVACTRVCPPSRVRVRVCACARVRACVRRARASAPQHQASHTDSCACLCV